MVLNTILELIGNLRKGFKGLGLRGGSQRGSSKVSQGRVSGQVFEDVSKEGNLKSEEVSREVLRGDPKAESQRS